MNSKYPIVSFIVYFTVSFIVSPISSLIFIFANSLLLGCQVAPTRVYESHAAQAKDSQQIALTDQTILVDARPAFEYSVSHLNGAIPLRPEDFTQRESPFLGILDLDHFALTRHLARLGISPNSFVVVVGRGPEGKGEEGRVAWTLKYLGVKNVRFAAVSSFKKPLTSSEAPPRTSATIWKPELDESLLARRDEVLNILQKPDSASAILIDVRADVRATEDTRSIGKKSKLQLSMPRIPWTEFVSFQGLPNSEIKVKLEAVGITQQKKIVLISEQGIESAEATLALRELGYLKATNFSGGFLELSSKKF